MKRMIFFVLFIVSFVDTRAQFVDIANEQLRAILLAKYPS